MMTSLANRDATFQQQSTNLVDHRRTSRYPALAHPVKGLQIQLVVRFDGYEAHPRTADRFRDSFRVDVIVLVRLDVRLHILGRHQPYIMSLFAQGTTQKVRSSAGFHADQ